MPERAHARLPRWLLRSIVAVFYGVLATMLVLVARDLDWAAARESLAGLSSTTLLAAGACSLATYALYAGYEILATRQSNVGLPRRTILAIGFASYACNLTLGAMMGALALRLRLYAQRGVSASKAAPLVAFNLLTNWSGYLLVFGTALWVLSLRMPTDWPLSTAQARGVGTLSLLVWLAYLGACLRHPGRVWKLRKAELRLPDLPTVARQLVLAVPVWLLSAASLTLLLPHADYLLVLVAWLGSAIAGLIVRIPAGLGVTEAVMLTALGGTQGEGATLAALLAFRCVHYLVPLLLGLLTALKLEFAAGRQCRHT